LCLLLAIIVPCVQSQRLIDIIICNRIAVTIMKTALDEQLILWRRTRLLELGWREWRLVGTVE
jgi:hypothetical protein